MSGLENKCDNIQQHTETTSCSELSSTETPVMESATPDVDKRTDEESFTSPPEAENMETTEIIANENQDNDSSLMGVVENAELTEAEIEHFSSFENMDSFLDGVTASDETKKIEDIEAIETIKVILPDEPTKQIIAKDGEINSIRQDINPLPEESTKEMPIVAENVKLILTDNSQSVEEDKHPPLKESLTSPMKKVQNLDNDIKLSVSENLSSIQEDINALTDESIVFPKNKLPQKDVEETTCENKVDIPNIDDIQTSRMETTDEQSNSRETSGLSKEVNIVSTDTSDIAIKKNDLSTSISMDTNVVSKELEPAAEEPIEHMETCDSQESINLVIDEETSNNAEVKDDADITKNNEEGNMDVDLNETEVETDSEIHETESPKSTKIIKENLESEAAKPSETINAERQVDTKIEDKNIPNKSKDDDVIPIEAHVPIIEIYDEEDTETESNTKEEQNGKNIDRSVDKSSASKNENIVEKFINDNVNECAKSNDKIGDVLLEKSSEKPLDDDKVPEEILSISDDLNETNDEVFYKKECINYECPHKHKQYFKVPQFAFSYFKVTKKKYKVQYICADCYDKALEMYEEFCGLIKAKQPLLLENIPTGRQEFVEIIDSSDDEDSCSRKTKLLEPTNTAFSKNDLTLIESELNATIKSVLNSVGIRNQLTWSKTILMERLKRLEIETEYVDGELRALQKQADKMHEGLYTCPKIKIRQLQPLDLNSGKLMSFDSTIQKEVQSIPPVGEIERPPIQISNIYFAVKNNPIASWVPCKVMEQVESSQMSYNVKQYKIKFIRNQTQMPKTVPAKYLAYYEPPSVRLPIGTRVIAYFDATSLARGREKINVQSAFYPGIIAEPLKPNNKFRYLIFYDDGYTQYVYHKDVRLVSHVSDCVWEDVHPASRDFIQKYLTQYSINRPMVQTQKGQSMNTESNGYWLHARVVDIDCSLVLMQFEGSKSHTEWIYRGSLRLGPVFKEYQKSLQKSSAMPVSRLSRRTEPFIRYTEDEENTSQPQQSDKAVDGTRAVARKTFGRPESMMNSTQSTSNQQQQQQPAVKHLNNSTIYVEDENKPKGKVVYYTAKRNLPPRKYKPHKCSPSCQFEITHNLSAYSPLSKPLLSGWERFIIRQKIKRVVTYRAPCGKILRNMKELHHYLRATNNVLNVDNFDFSHEISCLAEYVIESAIIQKRDISGGQEKMPIPLVNYYDNTLPPECKYSAKVIPTEGVNINTDPAFLVGCDCEDDCADKTKCACWQLTLAGAKYGNPNAAAEEVGYQYRRLLDHVPTGIYECNANCKCKSSCLNRVVQNSLTMKLQVFKTSNRGWGLRCINDIPRGSFVCVYAGHLLTEAKANEGGQDAGDEYFAELDYIEVAEQIKEGYESDVELPEPEEEDAYHPEMDDDFTPSKSFLTRSKQKQNAIKTTRSSNQEEDSQERQVINFNPNADMNEDSVRENSIRKLYGNDEACYVMDAKISGNLGRYFNHSCAPNMFVQNVFVNTHDLRFPNVAFFSSCNIRAGTELTWNYNYEVGVVPGKVLYCQCGASNCRLRLL